MRMTDLSGISAQEYEALKSRQRQLLRQGDIAIRPAPRSRTRNSQALTPAQLEQLRQDLLSEFRW
jgi:hypothetical protein